MLDQVGDLVLEPASAYLVDLRPIGLERAADVVLEVDQLAHQRTPIGESSPQTLVLIRPHVDGPEPTQQHHLNEPVSIIAVGLVRCIANSDVLMWRASTTVIRSQCGGFKLHE